MHPKSYGPATFTVTTSERDAFQITVKGRVRWALESLIEAGHSGCTPYTTPGPRWSAYVKALRDDGVPIETKHESHGGPFKGTHARYVLKAAISRVEGAE